MDETSLTELFSELYQGGQRSGWDYEDLPDVQVLRSEREVWARRVSSNNETGAWTRLPPP